MRPIIEIDGPVTLELGVDTEYQDNGPQSNVSIAGAAGDPWETAWDVAWTGAGIVYRNFNGINGLGFAIAPLLDVQATSINLKWSATDFVYEYGGVL